MGAKVTHAMLDHFVIQKTANNGVSAALQLRERQQPPKDVLAFHTLKISRTKSNSERRTALKMQYATECTVLADRLQHMDGGRVDCHSSFVSQASDVCIKVT